MSLLPSSIGQSVSRIAQQVTGSASGFRQVLAMNPGSLSFLMPPQVQAGLAIAQQVNSTLGLGLRVPSSDDLKNLATGQLDLVLKGARRDVLGSIEKTQSSLAGTLGTSDPQQVLNSIEWLF